MWREVTIYKTQSGAKPPNTSVKTIAAQVESTEKDIMKIILILAALCATAMARPQSTPRSREIIPILQRDEVRDDFGQYSLRYHSGDGTMATEQGTLKLNKDMTDHVLVQKGTIRYTAPDGTPIALDWVADENGFRATGDHLPVIVSVVPEV